ncbi:MAG: dephospho-CoA kinase [Henriciella sp.]|nr:dephospho-CoA kinase [Henriciella sp.]MBO6694887.1 dephospho-CoA kinase [Henriciella sp.]
MIILGLTGSIGMGKSATAAMFATEGLPVYDADAAVHALYEKGGAAVAPLSERFGDILKDGAVDRAALRAKVVDHPDAMKDLEQIVHPLVGQSQLNFRQQALESESKIAVLDIPLLFETGGDQRCDFVAVVTAPADLQKARVLARGEMSEEQFEQIRAKQMSDADKRARADFIISTAFGFDFARAHVQAIIELLNSLDQNDD